MSGCCEELQLYRLIAEMMGRLAVLLMMRVRVATTEPVIFPAALLPGADPAPSPPPTFLPMLSLSRAAPVRLASRPQLPLHMTRRPAAQRSLFISLCIYLCVRAARGGETSQWGRCDSELPLSAFFICNRI